MMQLIFLREGNLIQLDARLWGQSVRLAAGLGTIPTASLMFPASAPLASSDLRGTSTREHQLYIRTSFILSRSPFFGLSVVTDLLQESTKVVFLHFGDAYFTNFYLLNMEKNICIAKST